MKFIREISRSDMDLAIQEASIISYLQSDELIRYVDMFYFKKQFFIILEYMELSGMKNICVKNYMNHSEDFCRYTLYKVAKGIASMHKEGILHRDIKSDNILHNLEGEIKIADMGFACVLSNEEQKGEVGTGTTHWIAPEVKKGTLYSKKVDVWSFGCLAYELATGSPPFFDLNRSALTYNVMNIDVPKIRGNWSNEFKDFVKQCLKRKPSERLTMKKALYKHPFLSGIDVEECKEAWIRDVEDFNNRGSDSDSY